MKLVALLICLAVSLAGAEEWKRFRGPQGNGHTDVEGIPSEWSLDENLAWKTELPGDGASCPAIWQDRMYLTCYSGYYRWERSQDFEDFGLHVVCLNTDGEILWSKEVPHDENQRRGGYGGPRWHGYATGTPVVAEEGLYVSFGHNGFYALDHDGNVRWSVDPGERAHGWGYGASPMIHGDMVIMNFSAVNRHLRAYDRESGELLWDTDVEQKSWSVPIVVEVGDEEQLIMNVRHGIAGFNPGNGEKLWFVQGGNDYQSTSPIEHEGIVYYSLNNTHKANTTMALKLQEGDEPEILWKRDDCGAVVGTAVFHEGRLYFSAVDDRTNRDHKGFWCLDAETGKTLYHVRTDPQAKTIYASPILAGGRVFYAALQAGVYVLEAGPEYSLLAHNRFDAEDGHMTATPVPLDDGRLLLRSDRILYCVGGE
jgi:hypothetical protein